MKYSVKTSGHHQNALTTWCYENGIEDYSIWTSTWNNHPYNLLFEFEKKEDAVAFRLRWG